MTAPKPHPPRNPLRRHGVTLVYRHTDAPRSLDHSSAETMAGHAGYSPRHNRPVRWVRVPAELDDWQCQRWRAAGYHVTGGPGEGFEDFIRSGVWRRTDLRAPVEGLERAHHEEGE